MNIQSSSENQSSSQCTKPKDQPDLKILEKAVCQEIEYEQVCSIINKLAASLKYYNNQKFEVCYNIVVKLIEKGYTKQLAKNKAILQYLMDGFNRMVHQIDSQPNMQFKIMSILSAVAQLMKQSAPYQISIKKYFLKSLLLIDVELLKISPIKNNILAVLGVIYSFISRQGKILKKFQLNKQFKKAILTNYCLLEQKFSFILFNKALYNLVVQGQQLSEAELTKYKILSTLSKVIGASEAAEMFGKIKQILNKLPNRKDKQHKTQITQMLAQS